MHNLACTERLETLSRLIRERNIETRDTGRDCRRFAKTHLGEDATMAIVLPTRTEQAVREGR